MLFPTAFCAAGAKTLQYLQRLAIQTCGRKGTKDNMRRGGKDLLQSEVIHSHPGVVNVKKHPVQVHVCTNNLQGRRQMLVSQLSVQSDTQTEGRNPCALTHSRASLRQACPISRGCTERGVHCFQLKERLSVESALVGASAANFSLWVTIRSAILCWEE